LQEKVIQAETLFIHGACSVCYIIGDWNCIIWQHKRNLFAGSECTHTLLPYQNWQFHHRAIIA